MRMALSCNCCTRLLSGSQSPRGVQILSYQPLLMEGRGCDLHSPARFHRHGGAAQHWDGAKGATGEGEEDRRFYLITGLTVSKLKTLHWRHWRQLTHKRTTTQSGHLPATSTAPP